MYAASPSDSGAIGRKAASQRERKLSGGNARRKFDWSILLIDLGRPENLRRQNIDCRLCGARGKEDLVFEAAG